LPGFSWSCNSLGFVQICLDSLVLCLPWFGNLSFKPCQSLHLKTPYSEIITMRLDQGSFCHVKVFA
jgi:hypothetical protein